MTTTDDEAARQPLLSDADHDAPRAEPHHAPHWLEQLVFKTRLRFAVSLIVFFVFWTFAALVASGDIPYNRHGHTWPWTKQPDYTQHPGFFEAMHRLAEQPFCLPDVGLLTSGDFSKRRGWADPKGLFEMIGNSFDELDGSVVRESPQQHRRRLQISLSLVQGEPFYTRTAGSSASANSSATLRSYELWRLLDMLSAHNDDVTIEQLIDALQLDHTRVVASKPPALETTLADTQHLSQSLLAIRHDILSPLRAVDSQSVRSFFSPHTLTTDGVTASTHSPFTLVRQGLSRHGALAAVGTHGSRVSLQQLDRKLDMLVLAEVSGATELTIAVNVERGLTGIILSELSPSQSDEEKVESMVEWMRSWYTNVVYALDWVDEDLMEQNWAGTYRYQHLDADDESVFNQIEVDIQIDERVPWITRIEYSPRTNGSSTISVLKQYNVGGTADFLASWTCQHSAAHLSRCFRPLVRDDDTHCRCGGYKRDFSHYRVGLWSSVARKPDGGRLWTIPQGAIRRDAASYMDQGVGGCPALWKTDAHQTVPEMQDLGYHVEFVEGKQQLRWTVPGLVLDRISK
ncbi:uncharacterized protein SRS1_21026 [Sporisorium reilianum f. sp. reilianum]|uniref:Uncharacterized protein n=1 Tax=Sporisorium reilianum f. sp. reilianum TaxID=72559 RepID=A0A2N8UM50_9BASI|nr:uncharacterized protein SRS1_21026 [Sporisorium reilianum f. sp. reilianum]